MMLLRLALSLGVATAYCPAGNTIEGDSNLGPVNLVGDGQTIDDRTDCPGGVGVIDLTSKSASLKIGGSYKLHFQATTCGGGWDRMTFAYIDFNGNGVYDANELLGQETVGNAVTPYDVFFPFVVPSLNNGTKVGSTRMRVFVVESGFKTDPCQSFSYGGVKEFSISIIPATAYCQAGNTYIGDSNLGRVKLVGEEQTAIDDPTNCPGSVGVIDLTSESAFLKPAGAYHLDFQVTTCDAGWPRLAFAYIDFNGNGVYENPSELLGQQQVGNAVTPYDVSFLFVVPSFSNGTQVGRTRMRVFVVESGFNTDPCQNFSYGGVKEFSIDIAPSKYCRPAGNTNIGDSNLGRVKLVGEAQTAIDDPTNCPGGVGVIDLTSESAFLKPGWSYNLDFQATTCGAGWTRLTFAYIDFDGDGVYAPSELLGQQTVANSRDPYDVSFTFVVPKESKTGTTRMRVSVVENGLTPDPCATFAYGGVKEFSIEILPPEKYCPAGNTVMGDSNLGPVKLIGDGTVISDTTDCPGGLGVIDLTAESASLSPGRTYQLYFQATTCGLGMARLTYAFIDFNSNGEYEPSELLGQQLVDNSQAPREVSFSFDVPQGSQIGKTRMRVFVVESGFSTDPCAIFSHGGVKEFSINIADANLTRA